jgi:sugar phosphate permease
MAVAGHAPAPKNHVKTTLRGWVVCLCASLFFFYEFIQLNMFNAINGAMAASLHLTAAQVGSLSAYYLYATIALLFIAGLILDRYSTRLVMLLALLTCIIGLFWFSTVQTLGLAKLCYALTGIGGAFVFLSCLRLASRWFAPEHMALITGCIVTMAMLGGDLAQWPLMHLVEAYGWRQAIIIDAYLGIAIWAIIFLVVRDYPPQIAKGEETQHQQLEQLGVIESLLGAFKQLHNWLCGLYTCLMNLPISLLGGVWGVLFLVKVHHLSNDSSAIITSMLFWGTIIGSPIMGLFSDVFSMRKAPMLYGAVVSLAVMVAILMLPNLGFVSLSALFFLLGFVTSTQVLSYPFIAERSPAMITATSLSVGSFVIMGGQGIFRWFYGVVLQWHAAERGAAGVYTAADYTFAAWLFPITIIVAFAAAALTRSRKQS